MDQAIAAIDNVSMGSNTGSSQYESAASDADSDESPEIKRMSLGPSGASMFRRETKPIKTEPRSIGEIPAALAPVMTPSNIMDRNEMQTFLKQP